MAPGANRGSCTDDDLLHGQRSSGQYTANSYITPKPWPAHCRLRAVTELVDCYLLPLPGTLQLASFLLRFTLH